MSQVLRTGGAQGTHGVNYSYAACGKCHVSGQKLDWEPPSRFAHVFPSKGLASVSRKETHRKSRLIVLLGGWGSEF